MPVKRSGKPDAATVAALEPIKDIERFETRGEPLDDPKLNDWYDLLKST